MRAALAAASRAGRLTPAGHARAKAVWEDFWAATRAVELTGPVTTHAGALAGRHALRGADAVHLASVVAIGGGDTVLAVWDHRLLAGARAAGLRTAPA